MSVQGLDTWRTDDAWPEECGDCPAVGACGKAIGRLASLDYRASPYPGTYGVARTAAALKLNYYDLQKRLQARTSPTGNSARPSPVPSFVELPAAALVGPTECLIELENAAGSKMRLHLKGAPTADLVTLSGRLWEAQQ